MSFSTSSLPGRRRADNLLSLQGRTPDKEGAARYVCQRCRKYINIDKTLEDLDNDNLFKGKEGETAATLEPSTMSPETQKTFVLFKLFELASDVTNVDHPLCNECCQLLTLDLHKQLTEVELENERYTTYLAKLDAEKLTDEEIHSLDNEIEKMKENERTLLELSHILDQEAFQVNQEVEKLILEGKKTELHEERFWQTCNDFEIELVEFEEEKNTVLAKRRYTHDQLEKLRSTDVYNDTFHIWNDGHFGTINNLRMGTLQSQPVDWNEINAAWGQAALLLYTLAKRCNFTFSTYRIIPYGSSSKMERIDDGSVFELYGSREITLGKLLWFRRFDTAMVAFIKCLKELADYAVSQDTTLSVPFKITREKIDGISIKKQFNTDEDWTRALKLMLIDMKFLLAWVAGKHSGQQPTTKEIVMK